MAYRTEGAFVYQYSTPSCGGDDRVRSDGGAPACCPVSLGGSSHFAALGTFSECARGRQAGRNVAQVRASVLGMLLGKRKNEGVSSAEGAKRMKVCCVRISEHGSPSPAKGDVHVSSPMLSAPAYASSKGNGTKSIGANKTNELTNIMNCLDSYISGLYSHGFFEGGKVPKSFINDGSRRILLRSSSYVLACVFGLLKEQSSKGISVHKLLVDKKLHSVSSIIGLFIAKHGPNKRMIPVLKRIFIRIVIFARNLFWGMSKGRIDGLFVRKFPEFPDTNLITCVGFLDKWITLLTQTRL